MDGRGRVLLDVVVRVAEGDLYNPMSDITGLTREEILESETSFESARSSLKALCGRKTVIVGQCPANDIEW